MFSTGDDVLDRAEVSLCELGGNAQLIGRMERVGYRRKRRENRGQRGAYLGRRIEECVENTWYNQIS